MLPTIIDRTVSGSNTVEALFEVALLNGIGITDDVAQDVVIVFPDTEYDVAVAVVKPLAELGYTGSRFIKPNQKITDFATQFAGTLESLFDVCMLNGIGITDEVNAGTELKVNVAEAAVADFYNGSVLDIVTNERGDLELPGGIGYMQIGTSFIVS